MAKQRIEPFAVKDCTLAAIATGRRAQNLRELRDRLEEINPDYLDFHFWGGLLRPRFDDPEYNNDFASWARHALHDTKLAEQLGVIDPAAFPSNDALRHELIDIIEERLDETEFLNWASRDQQFHFVRAQIVVFDTGRRLNSPQQLAVAMPTLSLGSIYYHIVDARRREPHNMNDFHAWVRQFGEPYTELCAQLAAIDPYFVTLRELRAQLALITRDYREEASHERVA
jgi:hypothetical protein